VLVGMGEVKVGAVGEGVG